MAINPQLRCKRAWCNLQSLGTSPRGWRTFVSIMCDNIWFHSSFAFFCLCAHSTQFQQMHFSLSPLRGHCVVEVNFSWERDNFLFRFCFNVPWSDKAISFTVVLPRQLLETALIGVTLQKWSKQHLNRQLATAKCTKKKKLHNRKDWVGETKYSPMINCRENFSVAGEPWKTSELLLCNIFSFFSPYCSFRRAQCTEKGFLLMDSHWCA